MPRSVLAGTDTRWIERGEGPNPALFLHCGLGRADMWRPLMALLGSDYRMTAMDLPGHGDSGAWQPELDYQAQCVAVAQALLSDTRADLIGHSFGATIALRIAVERPDLVRNLILIEPLFFAAAREEDIALFEHHMKASAPFADAMRAGDLEAGTRHFYGMWGGGVDFDAMGPEQQAYLRDRIHLIVATEPALFDDNAGLLTPGRLESLQTPTLLVKGENSPPIIDVIHRSLARRLPDVYRAEIAGAGHMSPLTHHREVGKEVMAFLRSS